MSLTIDSSLPAGSTNPSGITFAQVQSLAASQITSLLPSGSDTFSPSDPIYNAVGYEALGVMSAGSSWQTYISSLQAANAQTDASTTADSTSTTTNSDNTDASGTTATDPSGIVIDSTSTDPAATTTTDPTATTTDPASTGTTDATSNTPDTSTGNMTDELLQESGWTDPAANPYAVTTDFFAEQSAVAAQSPYNAAPALNLGNVYNSLA